MGRSWSIGHHFIVLIIIFDRCTYGACRTAFLWWQSDLPLCCARVNNGAFMQVPELIEYYIMGFEDLLRVSMYKVVCTIVVCVSEECAQYGFQAKFISVLLWDVHMGTATKYSKVRDIGFISTPHLLSYHVCQGTGRRDIAKGSSILKCIKPVYVRESSVTEHRVHFLQQHSIEAFCHTIVLGYVWCSDLIMDTSCL